MNNIVTFDGHLAVIAFDPELGVFRGEFSGVNGGADFCAGGVVAQARGADADP